jgi:hypothetical protein
MKQAEFERHVGAENICKSITEALLRASELYQKEHAERKVEPLATKK